MLLTDTKYQLLRNRPRTVLLILISALLCGCVAMYMGNLSASEIALNTLNESTPAKLQITNPSMSTLENMNIQTVDHDLLLIKGLRDPVVTSRERGCLKKPYKPSDPVPGDTEIRGISCLLAAGFETGESITFADGRDETMFSGTENLCVLRDTYAKEHGLSLGDTISMELCHTSFDMNQQPTYFQIGTEPVTLTVAGIYDSEQAEGVAEDMLVPVEWVRSVAEERLTGYDTFTYDSFSASLENSMELNAFKDYLKELGYAQPYAMQLKNGAKFLDYSKASTVLIDDQAFIKTAEKLGGTLQYYKMFLPAFFVMIAFLTTLVIFLVLRGSRRDMAVALSLGRPKPAIAASHFLGAFLAQLIACGLVVPLTLLLAGLELVSAALICGSFLLCCVLGDVVGLLALLRFDAMELLLKAE